ncbi:MAG: HAMP domain-containing histidine kinase, partial [Gemmatimonadetes bacterium]|nr:HAMP domain-containing histidine kinase [Gemmatimonadota bacterium]
AKLRDTGCNLLLPPRGRTRYKVNRYNRTQMTRELRKWRRAQTPGNPDWSVTSAVDGSTYPLFRHLFFFSGGTIGLDLTRELSKSEIALGRRIADAFDVAYRRFVELHQKEQRNRELEIDRALERVRADVASMQQSHDLVRIVDSATESMKQLVPLTIFGIDTVHEAEGIWRHHAEDDATDYPLSLSTVARWHENWKTSQTVHGQWSRAELEQDMQALFDAGLTRIGENWRGVLQELEGGLWQASVPFAQGSIGMFRPDEEGPFSDGDIRLLERIAEVVALAYTRFVDFQKVEAEAKRARIDRAAEHIRAEAMAMHGSDDLYALAATFFAEVRGLSIDTWYLSLAFIEAGKITTYCNALANWASMGLKLKQDRLTRFRSVRDDALISVDHGDREHMFKGDKIQAFETQQVSSAQSSGDIAAKRRQVLNNWTGSEGDVERVAESLCAARWIHQVPFSHGVVSFTDPKNRDENTRTMGMLAESFSLGYQRYLDFQKVEQQNRELTIQNALGRVRSRALGMQNSEELLGVVSVLSDEYRGLGIDVFASTIVVPHEEDGLLDNYVCSVETFRLRSTMSETLNAVPSVKQWLALRSGECRDFVLSHEEHRRYVQLPGIDLEGINEIERQTELDHIYIAVSRFDRGYLGLLSYAPHPDDDLQLARRFTGVFEFAYSRFLELKAKEDQNRELAVERSLERVRTAIAEMASSRGIEELIVTVGQELRDLGTVFDVVGINTINQDTKMVTFRSKNLERFGSEGLDHLATVAQETLDASPAFTGWCRHWSARRTWHRLFTITDFESEIPTFAILRGVDEATVRHHLARQSDIAHRVLDVYFDNGSLVVARTTTREPFSDVDIALLERFTEVFALGYRRHLDLTAAEERAQQAEVDRAAEHIRAEAMAMRGSADLMDVVGMMHQSLHELGVEPFSTSIHFVDEAEEQFQHYLAIKDLEPHGFVLSADEESELQAPTKLVEGGWRVRWTHSTENERRLAVWRDGRITTGVMSIEPEDFPGGGGTWQIRDADNADWSVLPRGKADYTQVPFQYGIVTFTVRSVSEDHIATVQALAEALSLGYMRFQDFQRLEQASLNKSQFLRRMSHDLRSPMNAIIGYSRLLQRRLADRMDEREARNLANIETSSGNLLNLINDILDLSRIEAGRIEVNNRDFDPCALANECADSLESIVKEGVTLIRDLAAVGQISSDPDRLRQVVMNLLGNATKFTEAGSITLSLKRDGDRIELSVADTGIGIPADDLPHIFDEFRQVERQGGAGAEGTGLGLAIAKKTVDLLGGEIAATSQGSAGTTFTVRLPV